MTTTIPRAATSEELALFESDGQAGKIFAIFDNPPTVFTCRVNATFATHDMVYEFAYDGAVGTYGDVKAGMTVLIGSAAGLDDLGQACVHKSLTAGMFYIIETSGIAWANDLYITVLYDFGVWVDYLTVQADGTAKMRRDVAYTDQHTKFQPVVILGPDRVVKLSGVSVVVTLDGSSSWVPDSTIASHAFGSSGGTLTNANTATPTLTLTAAGRYVYWDTVTSAAGVTAIGYRLVIVHDDAHPPAEVGIKSDTWDLERGGQEISIEKWETATSIRWRSKVIIFSEDTYGGGVVGSLGYVAGAENIIGIGWIDKAISSADAEGGNIQATVRGAHYWLQKTANIIPLALENTSGAPAAWTQMQNITVDKMLWHFLVWRTTVTNCMDVYLTDNTLTGAGFEASTGNIWGQIQQLAGDSIKATICCDPWLRLWARIDTCLLPFASRSAIPVVCALDHDDWESLTVESQLIPQVGRVILSGVTPLGGAIFSLAPGHDPLPQGGDLVIDKLLVADQASANVLAASIQAKENCAYRFTLNNLLANNRLVGVWPPQRVHLHVLAADTPSGITFDGNALVRSVQKNHDPQTGEWSLTWQADAETVAGLSCNGDIPPVNPVDPPWVPPHVPQPPLPPPMPPPVDPVPAVQDILVILVPGYGVFYTGILDGFYTWYSANSPFTAVQIAALKRLELSYKGLAFVSTTKEVYSTRIGSNFKTVVGNEAFFDPMLGAGYTIRALGMTPGVDQGVGVVAAHSYPGYASQALTITGTTLVARGGVGAVETDGSLSNYGGNWYFTAGFDLFVNAEIARYPGNFGIVENALYITGPQDLYHFRAAKADYIFLTTPFWVMINKGMTKSHEYKVATGYGYYIDCDPTGQYLMSMYSVDGTLEYSSNIGVSWTTLTTLPNVYPIKRDSGCVHNMGTALTWVVSYLETFPGGVNMLRIFRTIDAGATWVDCLGNLFTSLFVPSGHAVTVIRHA